MIDRQDESGLLPLSGKITQRNEFSSCAPIANAIVNKRYSNSSHYREMETQLLDGPSDVPTPIVAVDDMPRRKALDGIYKMYGIHDFAGPLFESEQ